MEGKVERHGSSIKGSYVLASHMAIARMQTNMVVWFLHRI